MHREGVSDLEPLDPEIERTCRTNRKKKKKRLTWLIITIMLVIMVMLERIIIEHFKNLLFLTWKG